MVKICKTNNTIEIGSGFGKKISENSAINNWNEMDSLQAIVMVE
jgi:hypothetical protein